jgi:hypothetical protein
LLIAADRGDLRYDSADPAVGRAEHQQLEPMFLDPRIAWATEMGGGPARFDGKNRQPRRRSPPSTPNSTSRRSTMVLPSEARFARGVH